MVMKYRNERKSPIYVKGVGRVDAGSEFEYDGKLVARRVVEVKEVAPVTKKKEESE